MHSALSLKRKRRSADGSSEVGKAVASDSASSESNEDLDSEVLQLRFQLSLSMLALMVQP